MNAPSCRVLVTGARGFIGRNLGVRLGELPGFAVSEFLRGDDVGVLSERLAGVDAVVHLAGENRPADERAFAEVNAGFTRVLCDAIRSTGRPVPLILASSTQAAKDNPYGRSKRDAERAVEALCDATGNTAVVFRLPGVFGKWCRPHYNSVVATFCHDIARGLPIAVRDPTAALELAYIDDVVTAVVETLRAPTPGLTHGTLAPVYTTTLGELASQIQAFEGCRTSLTTERVGTGLTRALYATYVSFLPPERFSYPLPQHADARGVFVEMLKTPDSGQFSYFTAHPGVTRGGHYHHTKTEKFLVIKGTARFRCRHLLTGEIVEFATSGKTPQVVDTIPGWAHDITNIGEDELVVMIWANEVFDRARSDTISSKV